MQDRVQLTFSTLIFSGWLATLAYVIRTFG